jgi:hypothetical protein
MLRRCFVFASFASFALVGAAHARTASPKAYVPDDERNIEGGRKVLILLHSVEEGDDNPYDRSVSRQQAPLRDVYPTDDFERQMPEALKTVVESVPWIGARDVETTAEFRWSRVEQEIDAANTRQLLLLRVEHLVSPDYQTLKLTLRAALFYRQIPKGLTSRARFKSDWTPYQLDFVVKLSPPGAHGDSAANREFWAAEGGRRLHVAIDQGIAWIAARFKQTLEENEQQSLAWRKPQGRGGTLPDGSPGWVLERSDRAYVGYDSRKHSFNLVGAAAP